MPPQVDSATFGESPLGSAPSGTGDRQSGGTGHNTCAGAAQPGGAAHIVSEGDGQIDGQIACAAHIVSDPGPLRLPALPQVLSLSQCS